MSRGLQPGDVFGPYRIIKMLGRGAMGEVALVQHIQLGSLYAFKVLGSALAGDAGARQRFGREMEALAAVDAHPGIVRVHASGVLPDGRPYFVMEYVEGQTLARALRHELPSELGIEVTIEIAEALGFLHQHGIVHRDVKPENVLLAAEGRARLSDFGLAKAVGGESQRLTLTGEMIGTPAYMAPEQARGVGEIGPWTDVYSCGVVLYEVLCGTVPHKGQTAIEICSKVATGVAFPAPSSIRAGVDPRVEAVCLKALSLDTKDRYADGAEFALALQAASAEQEPSGNRTLAAVGLAGLLVVLACAGGLWLSLGGTSSADPALVELPPELTDLTAHAEAGNWKAVLDGRKQAEGWSGAAREQWDRLASQARSELIATAWSAGRLEDGCAAWDLGPPLEDPTAALLLAAAERATEAPLGAIESPSERAWLAAWAGSLVECEAALKALEPEHALALRWRLRGILPALEVGAEQPQGDTPGARVARGERALALGRLGQAAAFLMDASGLSSELQPVHEVARARLALAWGDPASLHTLVEERLAGELEGVARLEAWVLAREVAPWLERDAREDLLSPLPAPLRDAFAPWALDSGAGLVRAREQAAAKSPEARAAFVAAGAEPVLASRSLALADLDACCRGLDGPLGIQLARIAAVLDAAERGHARPALLDRARSWLEPIARVREQSPALALVTLRMERLRAAPVEDDWEVLERASPGDPAGLRAAALAAETWTSWSIADTGSRTPVGFERAAAAWEAVEQASSTDAEAREARLRRVRALANAAAEDPPEAASWSALEELLAPQLAGLPIEKAAKARKKLREAVSDHELERVDALHTELVGYASALSPDDLRAIFLSAALGNVDAAEAYAGLAGDALALSLLELRQAEASGDVETLHETARRISEALPLPYATLVAAATQVDARGGRAPSPLDLALLVEEAPEEVPSVIELLRDEQTSPPDVGAMLERIKASGRSTQTRQLARALLLLWEDLQGNLASKQSWSLRAADVLDLALEGDPAQPGVRHLHAAALLSPSGRAVEDPLVLRAVRFDLELATTALPWALGPRVRALALSTESDSIAPQVDRVGALGWLWSAERQPLSSGVESPDPWAEVITELEPWDNASLSPAFQRAFKAGRKRTALGLYHLHRETFRPSSRARVSSKERKAQLDVLRDLLRQEPDAALKRGFEEAWTTLHADGVREEDTRRDERILVLRKQTQAPQQLVRAPHLAGLASGPSVEALRLAPDHPELWTQEIALRQGWDLAQHRAELWHDIQDDDRLFSPDQLRDPWSRTRAFLEGLHDGYEPHLTRTLSNLRSRDSRRWALGALRAAAFDRGASPVVGFYFRANRGVRAQREPSARTLRRAVAVTHLLERLDGPTSRALRSDLLLDFVYYDGGGGREFSGASRRKPTEEELEERERGKKRRDEFWAEGIRLGLEVDPERVSRECESQATSWYRRARVAALSEDDEALEVALERIEQADDDWGLEGVLDLEPWSRQLRENPRMRDLVPR